MATPTIGASVWRAAATRRTRPGTFVGISSKTLRLVGGCLAAGTVAAAAVPAIQGAVLWATERPKVPGPHGLDGMHPAPGVTPYEPRYVMPTCGATFSQRPGAAAALGGLRTPRYGPQDGAMVQFTTESSDARGRPRGGLRRPGG